MRLANDANCFALSEASDGAGAGARVVFGVILGTGTGGGVVVDGEVLGGVNAIAGEWGHNASAVARRRTSGPVRRVTAASAAASKRSSAGKACARRYGPGDAPTARAIAAAADAGDARAAAGGRDSMRSVSRRRSRASSTSLDPDVVVLGGGLSNIESLYARVPELWTDWVFSDRVDTRLARARHGDSSGVSGAAWLWPLMA